MNRLRPIADQSASPILSVQELAIRYAFLPTDNEAVAAAKRYNGVFVHLDPDSEIRIIGRMFGGYRVGERRQDRAREYALGRHPIAGFAIATIQPEHKNSLGRNSYSHVFRDMTDPNNMDLSDWDLAKAVFAVLEAERGKSPEIDQTLDKFRTDLAKAGFEITELD